MSSLAPQAFPPGYSIGSLELRVRELLRSYGWQLVSLQWVATPAAWKLCVLVYQGDNCYRGFETSTLNQGFSIEQLEGAAFEMLERAFGRKPLPRMERLHELLMELRDACAITPDLQRTWDRANAACVDEINAQRLYPLRPPPEPLPSSPWVIRK